MNRNLQDASFTDSNPAAISDKDWFNLKKRLDRSKFRSRFRLGDSEMDYIRTRGMDTIKNHAFDFISQRLAPANPRNEGKQTPMKGHPVFIAQHATGTCCRSCLKKWHSIKEGAELNAAQVQYAVSVIMRWTTHHCAGTEVAS